MQSTIDGVVIAKAVYFMEDDEEPAEYQSDVILHQGEFWLVARWLTEIATGKRLPDRIVPLKQFRPVLQSMHMFRLALKAPRLLFEVQAPSELLQRYGAVDLGISHTLGSKSNH